MFDDGVVVKYGQADKAHEKEFFRYFAKSVKAYFDKNSEMMASRHSMSMAP